MINWKNIEILIDEVDNPEGNILFLHGFTGNFKNKLSFRNFFNRYNFYGINLPGHGNSLYTNINELDQNFFVDIIIEFIKKYDLKNLIILGHSMGGGITLIVANKLKERVDKLVLEAPANYSVLTNMKTTSKLIPDNIDETKFIISKLIHDPIKFFGTQKNYEIFLQQEFNNLSKKSDLKRMLSNELMNNFFNNIQIAIKNIEIPTLLILGVNDEIVPTQLTINNFKTNFNNNFLKIIVVENASHLPLSENKDILWDVKKFLLEKY